MRMDASNYCHGSEWNGVRNIDEYVPEVSTVTPDALSNTPCIRRIPTLSAPEYPERQEPTILASEESVASPARRQAAHRHLRQLNNFARSLPSARRTCACLGNYKMMIHEPLEPCKL